MSPLVLNAQRPDGTEGLRRSLLEHAGFHVIEAPNASAALTQAQYLPSLVVLDTSLPGVDGFEVCRRLKADPRTRGIPVLLVSNEALPPLEWVRGIEAGADWYLTEPRPGVLTASVQAMLRRQPLPATAPPDLTEDNFRHAQKMEAIGHLACGVAHDFNNLLTAILGYTEMMMMNQIGEHQPVSTDLLEIRKAADRAADLTRQLLRATTTW